MVTSWSRTQLWRLSSLGSEQLVKGFGSNNDLPQGFCRVMSVQIPCWGGRLYDCICIPLNFHLDPGAHTTGTEQDIQSRCLGPVASSLTRHYECPISSWAALHRTLIVKPADVSLWRGKSYMHTSSRSSP